MSRAAVTPGWWIAFALVNLAFPYLYRWSFDPVPIAEIYSWRGVRYASAILGMVIGNGVLIVLARGRVEAMIAYAVSVLNVLSVFVVSSLAFASSYQSWALLPATLWGLYQQGAIPRM